MQALILKETNWSLSGKLTTLTLFHPRRASGSFSQGLIPTLSEDGLVFPALKPKPALLSGAHTMSGPLAWKPHRVAPLEDPLHIEGSVRVGPQPEDPLVSSHTLSLRATLLQ